MNKTTFFSILFCTLALLGCQVDDPLSPQDHHPQIQLGVSPPSNCDSANAGPYCGCMVISTNGPQVWAWEDAWDLCEDCCSTYAEPGFRTLRYYRPLEESTPGLPPEDCSKDNTGPYCGCQLWDDGGVTWEPAATIPENRCNREFADNFFGVQVRVKTYYPGSDQEEGKGPVSRVP